MAGTLQDAIADLSLDDVSVASDGRVHIANPSVARRVSALKNGAAARMDSTNSGCTNIQCRAPEADQLAQRGLPGPV